MDAHFHVNAVCSEISVPSLVMTDQTGALIEYEKMINYVRDMTGLEIEKYTEAETTFFGGGLVRVRRCTNKSCLEKNDGTQ